MATFALARHVAIVEAVDQMFALADTIERRVQAATASADKRPQAILAKAFSGELVPTEAELARAEGRTYETATELLARITAAGQTERVSRTPMKAVFGDEGGGPYCGTDIGETIVTTRVHDWSEQMNDILPSAHDRQCDSCSPGSSVCSVVDAHASWN